MQSMRLFRCSGSQFEKACEKNAQTQPMLMKNVKDYRTYLHQHIGEMRKECLNEYVKSILKPYMYLNKSCISILELLIMLNVMDENDNDDDLV